jgi:hypothetical protein
MGCNTCKQKNEDYDNSNGNEIKLVPDKIANGQFNEMNIILKLTTVIVIIAALPFILCALSLQLILTMFTPVWFDKIRNKWSNYWRGNMRKTQEKIIVTKNNAQRQKREKEFEGTPVYTSEMFEEVGVVENNEENE